jgi:hypothetical protein
LPLGTSGSSPEYHKNMFDNKEIFSLHRRLLIYHLPTKNRKERGFLKVPGSIFASDLCAALVNVKKIRSN